MQFKALYYACAAGAVLDSIMWNDCTRSPLTAEIKNIWLGQPSRWAADLQIVSSSNACSRYESNFPCFSTSSLLI